MTQYQQQQRTTQLTMLSVFLFSQVVWGATNPDWARKPLQPCHPRPALVSWTWWWEQNRDHYIPHASANPQSTDATHQKTMARERALQMLLHAADSELATQRATTAVALGQLGHARALPQLMRMTNDHSLRVRFAAWTGVGLINSTQADQALLGRYRLTEADAVAWLCGATVVKRSSEPLLRQINAFADQSKVPEAQRMAVRALRFHQSEGLRERMLKYIHESYNQYLVADALTTLSVISNPQDSSLLIDCALGKDTYNALPAVHKMRDVGVLRRHGKQAVDRRVLPNDFDYLDPIRLVGLQSISRLAEYDSAGVRTARGQLVLPLATHEISNGSQTELGLIMLALGHVGTPADVRWLKKYVDGTIYEDRLIAKRDRLWFTRHDGGRGCAAIAIGLIMRRHPPLQKDRDLVAFLLKMYLDPGQPDDLCAACALGLGLSESDLAAQQLPRLAAKHMRRIQLQPMTAGFTSLALGMLEVNDVVPLTERLLKRILRKDNGGHELQALRLASGAAFTKRGMSFSDTGFQSSSHALPLRAAAMGLRYKPSREAVPLLTAIAQTSDWAAPEAMRSLAACGYYEYTDVLLKLIYDRRESYDWTSAQAARCVGILLSREDDARRLRLHADSGYFPGMPIPRDGSRLRKVRDPHAFGKWHVECLRLGHPFAHDVQSLYFFVPYDNSLKLQVCDKRHQHYYPPTGDLSGKPTGDHARMGFDLAEELGLTLPEKRSKTQP